MNLPHKSRFSSNMEFRSVVFSYESQTTRLFDNLTLHLPEGWTGIVGPNGAGKTTLLKLAVGLLDPCAGEILTQGNALYCPQRTDSPPEGFSELLAACDGMAARTRGRLKIGEDWLERWDTLSHGDRKRAQIGTLLWQRPEVLALDEPTNHVDEVGIGDKESRQSRQDKQGPSDRT